MLVFNECKPTKEILTMKQKKAGFCCISKLRVHSTDDISGNKVEMEVIDIKNSQKRGCNHAYIELI